MGLFGGTNMVLAAGIGGAAFVGYCIYYDQKRRSAPGYKDSIRQKRRKQSQSSSDQDEIDIDLSNPNQLHDFFMNEMQKGEELIEGGQIEEGAHRLANAIVFSGQPHQMMALLQQAFRPELFAIITSKIPMANQRFARLRRRMEVENEVEEVNQSNDEDKVELKIQEIMEDDDLE